MSPSIVTARNELKYLVDLGSSREIVRVVREHLPEHSHSPSGEAALPGVQHWVTTVYFDTATRELFHAAIGGSGLKVRAKEYYDEHPGLAQLARDRNEFTRHDPLLWIEIKLSRPGTSIKRRVGIPKLEVPRVLEEGHISERIIEIQREHYGAEAGEILAEFEALTRRFKSPLRATALVSYRRTAWQDPTATLRVTLDRSLTYYSPPPHMWTDEGQLHRSRLGPPLAVADSHVLELKSRGEMPDWLAGLLEARNLQPTPFSKFVAASAAISPPEPPE